MTWGYLLLNYMPLLCQVLNQFSEILTRTCEAEQTAKTKLSFVIQGANRGQSHLCCVTLLKLKSTKTIPVASSLVKPGWCCLCHLRDSSSVGRGTKSVLSPFSNQIQSLKEGNSMKFCCVKVPFGSSKVVASKWPAKAPAKALSVASLGRRSVVSAQWPTQFPPQLWAFKMAKD